MSYARQYGVSVRIARIFNTYGPRMHENDGRVVSNFVCQALRNNPITIFGDEIQTRSFCYVADLIDGFQRLMNSSEDQPINLGNPGEFTMLELAEKVRALTGSTSSIVHDNHYRSMIPCDASPTLRRRRSALAGRRPSRSTKVYRER